MSFLTKSLGKNKQRSSIERKKRGPRKLWEHVQEKVCKSNFYGRDLNYIVLHKKDKKAKKKQKKRRNTTYFSKTQFFFSFVHKQDNMLEIL